MIVHVTPALPCHIPPLAAHMREADRREVWASHRHTPLQALKGSLERSELAWTALLDGCPAFMWGVAPQGSLLSTTGVPWLLGTEDMYAVRRQFARRSREFVGLMQERFPRLENQVHAANIISIRWLLWCGFSIDEKPVRLNGEDFYTFWREQHV